MAGKDPRRRPARTQALPVPQSRPRAERAARWLPGGRSLAIGFGLVALAGGAYVVALKTPIFAVQRIDIQGAPPALAAQIRTVLGPLRGESLVSFGRSDADRRLAGFAQIASVKYDRDFPHTLRLRVTVEKPVAVLRRASDSWLVSASGRVLQSLQPGAYPPLPRIWLAAETAVSVGAPVATGNAVLVASALPAAHLPARIVAVRDDGSTGGLVLQLAGGREVRLGNTSNLAVKLVVAAAVLPRAGGALYVDVSVPTRAVAGYDSATTAPVGNSKLSG